MEAAKGSIWEPGTGTVDGYPTPRYLTQRRWIFVAAAVLGIAPDLSNAIAEGVALLLGIPGIVHRRARREFAETRWLEDRGSAIASILDLLDLNAALLPRLLTAGHRTGIWRWPFFWDPRTGQRRSLGPIRAGPG